MNYIIKIITLFFILVLNSCTRSNDLDIKKYSTLIDNAVKYEFFFEKGDVNTSKSKIEIPDSIDYALLKIHLEGIENTLNILLPVQFIKYVAISNNVSLHKKNHLYLTISLIQRDMKAHSGGNYTFELLVRENNEFRIENIYYLYTNIEHRINPEFSIDNNPNNHQYVNKDNWIVKLKKHIFIRNTFIIPDSLYNENIEELFISNDFPPL